MSRSPTTGAGLRVSHGVHVETLARELSAILADLPQDPFAEEVIVVPNAGIGDWLQYVLPDSLGAQLAAHGRSAVPGILGNFQILTTNAFTNRLINGHRREHDVRWSRRRLVWYVHRAIDDIGRTSIPGAADNRLRVADAIAELFDHYATHRPVMLHHWRNGRMTDGVDHTFSLPESMRWQYALYRRVCALIDEASTVEALESLRLQVAAGEVPDHVPLRVCAFGFSSLGPVLRDLLDAVAQVRPVHVLFLHPVSGPWPVGEPEVTTEGASSSGRVLIPRTSEAKIRPQTHPLTARWGALALETPLLVRADEVSEVPPGEPPSSLLGSLQAALVDRSPAALVPLDSDHGRSVLAKGDGTVQVHACHGRVRQVEVLRDALRHLLDTDHTLHLDDILIVCPAIEAFAPLIPAIFRSDDSSSASGPPPLRVRIAELELAPDAPVVDAFMSILQAATSRVGMADVFGLVSRPVVMQRFGLDDEAVSRLMDLMERMKVTFGFDGPHRAQWGIPATIVEGTWSFAMTRAMMGLVVAAPDPLVGPGGVVPYDDLAVSEAPILGTLAEILDRLQDFVQFASSSHTIGFWLKRFESIIDDFTLSNHPHSGRAELLALLDDIDTGCHDAELMTDDRFSLEEMLTVLRGQLTQRSRRTLLRSGAITVSRVPAVQGVPFRVIAVLGADEDMFGTTGVQGDNVLLIRPCLGEPDATIQGRQALLNLVLAARQAIVITCEGSDINTNAAIPLAVPIQELLEACVGLMHPDRPDRCRLLAEHPRQSFHSTTMTPGLVFADRPFGFEVAAIRPGGMNRVPDGDRLMTSSPRHREAFSEELDLVGEAVVDPVKSFTDSAARIRIDSLTDEDRSDAVCLEANSLLAAQLARNLLDHLRQSPEFRAGESLSVPMAAWKRAIGASGVLPPGKLGDEALDSIGDEVSEFIGAIPRSYFDATNYRTAVIDLRLEDALPLGGTEAQTVYLQGAVRDIVGNDLVRLMFRRPTEAMYLAPAFELALMTLADPTETHRAVVVTRALTKKKGIEPVILSVKGRDSAERTSLARQFVAMASDIHARSLRSLLPVFPRASADLGRGRPTKARASFARDLDYSVDLAYFFGLESWDELVGHEALPDDPPGSARSRVERYARYIWETFDAVINVDREPFSSGSASSGDGRAFADGDEP